jgi:hypothetical protein
VVVCREDELHFGAGEAITSLFVLVAGGGGLSGRIEQDTQYVATDCLALNSVHRIVRRGTMDDHLGLPSVPSGARRIREHP